MRIDLSNSWTDCTVVGFGITQYTLFCRAYPMPLGFVWGFAFGGKRPTFQVLDSYVVPWARRQGVRSKINEAIFQKAESIVTGGRSKSGIMFMANTDYTFDPRLTQWSLTKGEAMGNKDKGRKEKKKQPKKAA
jgi:hypothetical protein